jgi:adenosine kinase
MVQHAREFAEAGVPFLFDPGQGMPMFNGEELLHFLDLADYVALNDYEAQLLQERTGESLDLLARRVKALIVTLGAEGSVILAHGRRYPIPSVRPEAVVDPTGCGDAYRAALLYGIANGLDWPVTGRLASLLGAMKIARRGGQNHFASRSQIQDMFKETFGSVPW